MYIEPNSIHLGDCMQLMHSIHEGSIDLILCDPPYGVLNRNNKKADWDQRIDPQSMWNIYRWVLKPGGCVILFSQGIFTADVIQSNREWFRYTLVWDKKRPVGFLNAKRMPLRQHEDICVFYREKATYNPQMRQCLPSERNHSRGRANEGYATNRCYGEFAYQKQEITDLKYPTSIIQFPTEHSKEGMLHPTQKPVDLMRYLIRTYSNEGCTVLDNCMGSGTTIVAAIMEGRKYIGIEKQKKYFEIAKRRIEQQLAQPRLF